MLPDIDFNATELTMLLWKSWPDLILYDAPSEAKGINNAPPADSIWCRLLSCILGDVGHPHLFLVDLLHVLTGLPTFPLPSGFHFKVYLNVSVARFAACGLSKAIPVLLSQ